MSKSLICDIARAIGGDWHGTYGTIPAPGHSRKDRSVSIRPHSTDPNDVVVHSFAGDAPLAIKDDLRRRGLLPQRLRRTRPPTPRKVDQQINGAASEAEEIRKRREVALWLWRRSEPIAGTLAERYLRKRGIEGALPPTLRFLPGDAKHSPTMVAAFGLANETDPDAMTIVASDIQGVHLTKLRPDGFDKADVPEPKIMLGRGHTVPIVLSQVNDGLGLAITEGIEDALTVRMMGARGVWAAGSAGRMRGLAAHIPAYVECVTVFIDADPSGERFGNALAGQLKAQGLEVIPLRMAEAVRER